MLPTKILRKIRTDWIDLVPMLERELEYFAKRINVSDYNIQTKKRNMKGSVPRYTITLRN